MGFFKNFFKRVEEFQSQQPLKITTDAPPPNGQSNLPEVTEYPPMPPVKPPRKRKPRNRKKKKVEPTPAPAAEPVKEEPLSEKDAATKAGEPWVKVTSVTVDADNVGNGSFDLDWNEIFVARLVKAGYKGKTDIDIVDQWFTTLCRNIALETYEQEMADPEKREFANRKELGNGRSEFS